jgi:hypothetical protein
MRKLIMITTAVGLCLAAPAFAQTPATPTADQKGLVTVNLQDVLNNLSADLKIDRANIPVTAQIPINAAANVCGVSVNVLSAQAASSPATCNAKTGSQELTQAVQQQMAAGGTAAGQTGTTAAVSNPPASTAPAPGTAAKPAATANAPAAAPAANPLAQNTAPAQQNTQGAAAPAQQSATPAQQNAAPAQQNAQVPAARAPAQQNAQGTAAPAQQNAQGMTAPAQQNAQGMAAPAQQNAQGTAAPAQQNAQAPQGTAPAAAQNAQSAPAAAGSSTAQGMSQAQPASASITLDKQQQGKIAEVFTKQNIKPANVTFAINTGAAVPASVTLAAVPASVVQIAPQFRGYSYFATNDRIVIVEPAKKTVVAVIPNGSGARAQAAPAAKQVQFTDQQREVIRKRTTTQKPVTTGSAKAGSTKRYIVQEQIPEGVALEEFSEDVVREVPTAKSYRYYRQDNDVVVVDPGERRVIEVIR